MSDVNEFHQITSDQLTQKTLDVNEAGKKPNEVIEIYNEWDTYETDYRPDLYTGAIRAAQFTAKYLTHQLDCQILDVAAGTGKVGYELSKLGFTNIQALEPAEQLFQMSPHRDLYRSNKPIFLGSASNTDIPDNEYDAVVIAGAFCEGHIPCSALHEMIRIVKPGGYFINVMREEYLRDVVEYRKLEPLMEELEQEGKWMCMEKTIVENYFVTKPGVVYVYRITKTDRKK